MTDAELLLWSRIRRKQLKGCQFYRQKPIENYIVDFYCPSAKLIVEVDGSQYYNEEGMRNDRIRDEHLSRLGLTVFRFSSVEVFQNLDGILLAIYEHLPEKSPWPPLKKGEG